MYNCSVLTADQIVLTFNCLVYMRYVLTADSAGSTLNRLVYNYSVLTADQIVLTLNRPVYVRSMLTAHSVVLTLNRLVYNYEVCSDCPCNRLNTQSSGLCNVYVDCSFSLNTLPSGVYRWFLTRMVYLHYNYIILEIHHSDREPSVCGLS